LTFKYFIWVVGCWLISGQLLVGQATHGAFTFVENKGQWPDKVLFRSDLKSGFLYLENDGLLFDLYDPSIMNKYIESHYNKSLRKELDKLPCHSYKVKFKGANTHVSTHTEMQTPHYYNYFLGNEEKKWGAEAYGYGAVIHENLYHQIDFKMYSRLFHLKYDFIVKPGGNVDHIQLSYSGIDRLAVIKGKLHVYTSVNHIIEDSPVVYQLVDGKRKMIAARYKLLDHQTIGFELLERYDASQDLIIDPVLMFATYSGSMSNNFGYTATFDSKGFLYAGSSAFGQGYPTTLGAYDVTFNNGLVDIAISKFDTTGTFLIYSTFIGGNSDELPHSLIVNSFDELFVFGTTSSFNYPTTLGCYDNTFNGGTPNNLTNGLGVNYVNGSDIVVSKLSANGSSLLASTYIGGSQNDGLNSTNVTPALNVLRYNYADEVRGEIDIDKNNNIYIATCTRSADFPITGGVFQPTYGGGALDGVIMKFDNNLQNLIWSSYLGGALHDAIYSLALDANDDIYVTGGTESSLFPVTTGVYDTVYNGGRCDGFVTHISQNGQQIISSTFLGTPTYDQSYFVELDRYDNVYLLGQTEATDSSFIKNVTWAVPGSGQFVAKLTPQLDSIMYATVFGSGTGINISPTAFLVDLCNKMYLAGWGGAVNNLATLSNNAGYTFGMPITADAFQSTTNGSDFYIMVLEDDGSGVVYGSYFGGNVSAEHVDGGTSRFDRKGKVYQAMCAGCGFNSDMPTSTNAWSATNNNSCNLGVFKFDFNLPVVVADFDVDPIGCAPFTTQLTNTSLSQNFTSFQWDFGDMTTSTQENPVHTYTTPGTYTITLVVSDTATCNFGDTLQKQIVILGNSVSTLTPQQMCPGEQVQIGILPMNDPSITYQWSPTSTITNGTISNPFASPSVTTTYLLEISDGICVDSVYQTVQVHIPQLAVSNDTTLCSTDEVVVLSANSFGTSTTYQWSSTNQFTDILNPNLNQATLTVSPDETTTYYVQVSNNGCTLYDSVTVFQAASGFVVSDDAAICLGSSLVLSAFSTNPLDNLTYTWTPEGVVVGDNTLSNVTVSPTESQYVWVTAINGAGCVLMDSVWVEVDPLPLIDVVATATPDTIISGGNSLLNVTPTSGYTYSWEPSATLNNAQISQPIASPNTTTTYVVTVAGNGCEKRDTVVVYVREVVCGPPDVFVPNAFTPNTDNKNDFLYVRGNNIAELVFRVYDRWGELVFETFDQSTGWDGTYKGKLCDPAVFVYYLEILCIDQEKYFEKGNVTLIR
jgi:gliding motility-associated-like protein